MRTTMLLLALLAIAPLARAADPAPATAPGPGEELGLLVDFVEIGRVDRSVPRDLAMVDLLNLSQHVLDVVIGEGAATLQPKERLIARVKAGDQVVDVTPREKGVAPMEGRLHLDAGVRYELAIAYGPVPVVKADIAPPGIDAGPAGAAADIAPRPAEGMTTAEPRREPRRKSGGKVDIGRRPRR